MYFGIFGRNPHLLPSYSQFIVNCELSPLRPTATLPAVQTADFHFKLPPDLIAQQPAVQRDASRLLVLHRKNGQIEHRSFSDLIDYLRPNDVLVLNNSRVIPARLHGKNSKTGGKFEILLLEENSVNDWWAMMRPGKRAPIGTQIQLTEKSGNLTKIIATVSDVNSDGHRRLNFSGVKNVFNELDLLGELPLPPYIERPIEKVEDRERYQTVYSQTAGSIAAPTAGLHFTPEILAKIRTRGVTICYVTLHVGAGTFLPVKAEKIAEHKMHAEKFEVSETTLATIIAAKRNGQRVIAVGTTATRTLETIARLNPENTNVHSSKTDIFIFPPATFQTADALLTNFHLPESTLLMLVSAFAAPGEISRGRELILQTYATAIRERYRFFSYGDAMLIL